MLSALFKAYNHTNKESSFIEESPSITTTTTCSSSCYDDGVATSPFVYEDSHAVSKPIEIKHYVPKHLEVFGLSQSLVCYTDPYYQNYIHDDFEDEGEYDYVTDAFLTIKEKAEIFYSSSVPNELVLSETMNPLHSLDLKQYLSCHHKGCYSSSDCSQEENVLLSATTDTFSHPEAHISVDNDCDSTSFEEESCCSSDTKTVIMSSYNEEENLVVLILDEEDDCEEAYDSFQENSAASACEVDSFCFLEEEKCLAQQRGAFVNHEEHSTDKETFVFVEKESTQEEGKEIATTCTGSLDSSHEASNVIYYDDEKRYVCGVIETQAPDTPSPNFTDNYYYKHSSDIQDFSHIKPRNESFIDGYSNQNTGSAIKEYYGVQEHNGACYYYGPLANFSSLGSASKYYTKTSKHRVSSPPTIATIPEVDEDYEEWCKLADERYGDLSSSLWYNIYEPDASLEKLKVNPFIHLFLGKNIYPLKVTKLPKSTQYKEIQKHFFNPNVLYIRHLRHYNCAYIVYRNYQQMMRAYHLNHMSLINKKPIHCEPSTMADLERDYEIDVGRRLVFNNCVSSKKYDTFIPNSQQIDQNLDCHLRYQIEKMQEEEKSCSDAPKYDIPIADTLHVLMKQKNLGDVELSKQWGYLPVQEDKVEYINQIWNQTPEVLLLVSKKQGRQFQGFAKMKSEVLSLADLFSSSCPSCPSSSSRGASLEFLKKAPGWHHACKVEWLSCAKVPMKQVGDLCNPWNNGRRIANAPAVSLIEPGVANAIIKLMNID